MHILDYVIRKYQQVFPVVRGLQVLDLHLVIAHPHGCQGTGHFLLDFIPVVSVLLQHSGRVEWSLGHHHRLVDPGMVHELCDGQPLGGVRL